MSIVLNCTYLLVFTNQGKMFNPRKNIKPRKYCQTMEDHCQTKGDHCQAEEDNCQTEDDHCKTEDDH